MVSARPSIDSAIADRFLKFHPNSTISERKTYWDAVGASRRSRRLASLTSCGVLSASRFVPLRAPVLTNV